MSYHSATLKEADPPYLCDICPRLFDFIDHSRQREPTWFNGPVPNFLPLEGKESVKLLIVGLAPGLRGANKTGQPFTGDFAGNILYSTLLELGLAKGSFEGKADGKLHLIHTAITNAVRCVPPQNKPILSEIKHCQKFLSASISLFPHLKVIITLGIIAYKSTLQTLEIPISRFPFQHGKEYELKRKKLTLFASYHCSRYNTNTRILTKESFQEIFLRAQKAIE